MSANPVYKWFSALLCYPEAEMIEALPEFQAALKEWLELQSQEGRLKNFLDYLGNHNLRELQENYVATFDRKSQPRTLIFSSMFTAKTETAAARWWTYCKNTATTASSWATTNCPTICPHCWNT